jgi:predicted DCC family thiol-disulfide oxidoreductase YuxK
VTDTVEIFYDGACPLCRREVALLRKLDRHERIAFTDISELGFNPNAIGLALTYPELMARIHGRLADGTVTEGVEVFRQVYAAVGLGPLVALSRLPGVSGLLNVGYRAFAKHRLRLTGRCSDEACEPAVRS